MRCSSLVEVGKTRILVDCGPDFYFQMLKEPFRRFDGVLLTHEHYDHVGGLDDLRPFCAFGAVDVYSEKNTLQHLRERMPYCFREHPYRGVPRLNLIDVQPHVPFEIGNVRITPLRVMHGQMKILGFRINDLAYITDMTTMPPDEIATLAGIRLLVVNALRHTPHPTHQTVDEAVAFARSVGSQPTYFVHMSHEIGLHAEVERSLPHNIHLAYDGLKLSF